MEKIKKHLNLKCYTSSGFYLSALTAVLCLVASIIYGAGFGKETLTAYYSATVVVLPIVGAVLFIALALFKRTAQYAPVVLWGFAFAGLLSFISTAYMYLSGIFYNGISAEAFAMIDAAFMGTFVLLALATVTGNVALWLGQTGRKSTSEGGAYEESL